MYTVKTLKSGTIYHQGQVPASNALEAINKVIKLLGLDKAPAGQFTFEARRQ